MYVKAKAVKTLAKAQGKRVSKDFILWLEGRVERIILEQCKALGSCKKTLNMKDASVLDAFFRRS